MFPEDPISGFINDIAIAVGAPPELSAALFPVFSGAIYDATVFGPTNLSGANFTNGLISGVTGVPLAPIDPGPIGGLPAAASGDLNTLLAIAGQPTLGMLPPADPGLVGYYDAFLGLPPAPDPWVASSVDPWFTPVDPWAVPVDPWLVDPVYDPFAAAAPDMFLF